MENTWIPKLMISYKPRERWRQGKNNEVENFSVVLKIVLIILIIHYGMNTFFIGI